MSLIVTNGPTGVNAPKAATPAPKGVTSPSGPGVTGDTLALAKKASPAPAPPVTEAETKALKRRQSLGGLATMAGLGSIGAGIWAVYMVPWGAFAAMMWGGAALAALGLHTFFKATLKLGEQQLAERAAKKAHP